MKRITLLFSLILLASSTIFAQSLDSEIAVKKMKKDLAIFKEIRLQANSGLYKYRTKKEIDSLYLWADKETDKPQTYRAFYGIICKLTDFEGSLHNNTDMSDKVYKAMKQEAQGYFPFPLKLVAGKWVLNFKTEKIPLGAEIISINDENITEIIPKFYKYYTTDGVNITGKSVGLNRHFSKFYRLQYGLTNEFKIAYKAPNLDKIAMTSVKSVSYAAYYKNFGKRHSIKMDRLIYKSAKGKEIYLYKKIDDDTGLLTINSFSIGGNADAKEHKEYVAFLDDVLSQLKKEKVKNLIIDVRNNGGGTDPNDLVTYACIAPRNFQESKQCWISFEEIPLLKYIDSPIPSFLRPLGVGKYNKYFQQRFPNKKDGKYYISETANEMKIREPHKNAFDGQVYLLIGSGVASAGSLFAAMAAGNEKTITIGEEAMGGYYGHNGHTGLDYVLPNSKIATSFSIDNIEQDVPKKANQIYNRGIIPDHDIPQSFEDFMNHKDTQMEFTLELIKTK